jgi:hypothetical protein
MRSFFITLETIEQSSQRYDTVGDWQFGDRLSNGRTFLQIKATRSDSPHHAFLVALHELVEAYLCRARGITQQEVDNWDMVTFPTLETLADEPGDDCRAPYYAEHRFATIIEQLMAYELGVDWYAHQDALEIAQTGAGDEDKEAEATPRLLNDKGELE